jgi:hypothetical protein
MKIAKLVMCDMSDFNTADFYFKRSGVGRLFQFPVAIFGKRVDENQEGAYVNFTRVQSSVEKIGLRVMVPQY